MPTIDAYNFEIAKVKLWSETNAHIPDSELEKDIRDTEQEITEWGQEAVWLMDTPMSDPSARWNHIRAESRKSKIMKAQEFIAKLKAILAYRKSLK